MRDILIPVLIVTATSVAVILRVIRPPREITAKRTVERVRSSKPTSRLFLGIVVLGAGLAVVVIVVVRWAVGFLDRALGS